MNPKGEQGMYSCGSAPPNQTSNFNISNMVATQTDTDHNCTFQATSKNKKALDQTTFPKIESVAPECNDCNDLFEKRPIKIHSNVRGSLVEKHPSHVLKKDKKDNNLNEIWFVNLQKGAKNLHTTIRNNLAYYGWYECPFDPSHRIKKPAQYIKHARKTVRPIAPKMICI